MEGIDDDITNILIRKDLDTYVKISQIYRRNKATLYSIVLGQCTEAMKNRLEVEGIFEETNK